MKSDDISKNWTPKERLRVIAKITEEMSHHQMWGRDEEFTDWQERLRLLSEEDSGFLEKNRNTIINGQRVWHMTVTRKLPPKTAAEEE